MDEKELTRRQFLKGISITCASSSLLVSPFSARIALGNGEQRQDGKSLRNLEHRTLGRTGLTVSALGYGVMRLTDRAVLFQALENGINYFDTAHVYQNGNNEKMLGGVLKEYGRDKAFIATKIPPYDRRMVIKQLRDTATMEEMRSRMLELMTELRRKQAETQDTPF